MSKLFKSFSEVLDVDIKFSKLITSVNDALKDCFADYDTYCGYSTNELREFTADLPSDLFEDDNEDLHFIWFAKKESVVSLMKFLENYDMIVITAGRPNLKRSNHPDVANLLREMLLLCK